jgi:hypothetical protein
MAAVLACGDDAVLSHRSAAELWGVGREWEQRIDVTIRRRGVITRCGIKVRARPSLPSRSLVRRFGIPVTTPVQALIDLATELKLLRLERAVNEADKLDLVDPETLRRELDGYIGMPAVKTLRTMLDRHTFRLSDSDLEILFRPLARAAAFPSPFSKHRVLGYEVDFWFPDHGLIVETDGLRYHRTPSQQSRMAMRDQKHTRLRPPSPPLHALADRLRTRRSHGRPPNHPPAPQRPRRDLRRSRLRLHPAEPQTGSPYSEIARPDSVPAKDQPAILRAAAGQSSATSPPRPSACNCAHLEISSESTATASVSPSAASRSSPSAYR